MQRCINCFTKKNKKKCVDKTLFSVSNILSLSKLTHVFQLFIINRKIDLV